jgi:hypothetical protein
MKIETIKELRKQIDYNIKFVESLINQEEYKDIVRELSLVRTKLQESKMWAGQALGVMGEELPKEFRDEYEV